MNDRRNAPGPGSGPEPEPVPRAAGVMGAEHADPSPAHPDESAHARREHDRSEPSVSDPAPAARRATGGGPARGAGGSPTGSGAQEPSHPARRFWSTRRLPAVALAVLLLAALGPLLYDVVAVRAERPAAAWRTELADQLANRTLDDPWVLAVAAALLLLGIALVVAALTPGLRGVLPMRRADTRVRPGVERNAAAQVVRDRAMEVAGVLSVRVRVGRSRVRVSARAHFRDLDEVRTDLDSAMHHAVEELDLAHRPALTIQVSRPAS